MYCGWVYADIYTVKVFINPQQFVVLCTPKIPHSLILFGRIPSFTLRFGDWSNERLKVTWYCPFTVTAEYKFCAKTIFSSVRFSSLLYSGTTLAGKMQALVLVLLATGAIAGKFIFFFYCYEVCLHAQTALLFGWFIAYLNSSQMKLVLSKFFFCLLFKAFLLNWANFYFIVSIVAFLFLYYVQLRVCHQRSVLFFLRNFSSPTHFDITNYFKHVV